MNTVIAAVDSSLATRPVLRMALALAPMLGAGVQAVHVGPLAELGDTARSETEALGLELVTLAGEPLATLGEQISRVDVAALVTGVRDRAGGRSHVGHLALGLADASAKPVLLVPPDVDVPERLSRVVVAIKGTPDRARPLRRAIELIDHSDLDLVVVHVEGEDDLPAFSDQPQYEFAAYADEFLARHVPGAPQARAQLRFGDPVAEILAAAREEHAQALAIGWSQNGRPNRGQLSHLLVAYSPIPVLLVPLATPARV